MQVWWDVPFADLEITVFDVVGITITDVVPVTMKQ
jgi:ornithine cyclodeaminase/alanine dehydrogenase-like protein (mu-crystallin family)